MTDGPAAPTPIDATPEWRALLEHYELVRDLHLRDLFAEDPDRGTRLTAEGGAID